jgi:hypothetical protein
MESAGARVSEEMKKKTIIITLAAFSASVVLLAALVRTVPLVGQSAIGMAKRPEPG